MTTDGELLPCPFCGGGATLEATDRGWWWVMCQGPCDVLPTCEVASREGAVESWNRRAELAREPVELSPLRDTFAAAALTGCLAYSHVNPGRGNYQENATPDSVAVDCYAYADAMMVARAARGEK